MIEALSEIVRNVAVIVFLTTVMDMLLPSSNMRSFIKMVMGLFVIVTILSPIVAVFEQDNFIASWDFKQQESSELDAIMAQGQSIGGAENIANQEKLAQKVAQQVEGLINIMPEVNQSKVTVVFTEDEKKLGSYGELERVKVWLDLASAEGVNIEPVIIEFGAESQEKSNQYVQDETNQVATKVKQMIASYYGLNHECIEIYLLEGDE